MKTDTPGSSKGNKPSQIPFVGCVATMLLLAPSETTQQWITYLCSLLRRAPSPAIKRGQNPYA